MKRILKSEAGVTLLEIMLALGILMLGSYLTIEGINQMESISRDTRNLSTTERQISMIVENIRTGLGTYQITFDPSKDVLKKMLDLKTLPMAWSNGVVIAVEECSITKTCPPGRYGYVVQPMQGQSKGLYIVTLRMTHPEWKEPFRDYEFLVTIQ